jgi:L-amino acid N-acyltransferase YncA
VLTAQVEPYADCIGELMELYPAHWEELALNKDKVPLAPMYEVYDAKDAAGEIMLVTLRSAGKLAGYFIGFVGPALHYRTCLTLTLDIFRVLPEYRDGTAGLKLFKAVKSEAQRRGVQRMFVGSKVHQDASILFQRLGFEPVETFYSCWLGGESW